jgi:hypothetical protein
LVLASERPPVRALVVGIDRPSNFSHVLFVKQRQHTTLLHNNTTLLFQVFFFAFIQNTVIIILPTFTSLFRLSSIKQKSTFSSGRIESKNACRTGEKAVIEVKYLQELNKYCTSKKIINHVVLWR